MNINDLEKGSYKEITPMNIGDLPSNSYKTIPVTAIQDTTQAPEPSFWSKTVQAGKSMLGSVGEKGAEGIAQIQEAVSPETNQGKEKTFSQRAGDVFGGISNLAAATLETAPAVLGAPIVAATEDPIKNWIQNSPKAQEVLKVYGEDMPNQISKETGIPVEQVKQKLGNIFTGVTSAVAAPSEAKSLQSTANAIKNITTNPIGVAKQALQETKQGIGAAGDKLSELKNKAVTETPVTPPKIIQQNVSDLENIENSRASTRNYVAKQKARGFDPKADIAKTPLLEGAVDSNGFVHTLEEGGAVEQYTQAIKPMEKVVTDALKREGGSIPLATVEERLTQAVNDSGMKGASKSDALAKVKREAEGLSLDAPNGELSLSDLHSAKIDKYGNVNYMNEGGRLDKLIAKTYKKLIEEHSSESIKELNDELARHYANIGYLEKLNGARVNGGKLGKYFAQVLGGIVGSHFGPIGAIVGSEVAGGIKGLQLRSVLSKGGVEAIKPSDTMAKTLQSNIEGSRQIPQAKTISPINTVMPQTISKPTTKVNSPTKNTIGAIEKYVEIPKRITPEDFTSLAKNVGFNKVQNIDIGSIKQTRTIPNEEMVKKNIEILKKNKELEPIIVSKNGSIVDGNHRYEAYKRLGIKVIPIRIKK